jgi:ribosomal protein L11 methyltransferase
VIRLAIRVRRAEAELALAELLELAPAGVEERDVSEGVVEYAVYGAAGELPELPQLQAAVGEALVDVSTSEVADDWGERWREFHRPLVIPGALAVRAPWHPAAGEPVEVVIDPGRAFGTGAHATTRLCLELLLELQPPVRRERPPASGAERPPVPGAERPPARGAERPPAPGAEPPPAPGAEPPPAPELADLGCGSGVLAIAAAKLGFAPVLALDNDPAAVQAARANALRNSVEIEVRRHDLRRHPPVAARIVLANLLGPLLLQWAQRLAELRPCSRPACVIAGGLLVSECAAVVEAFAPLGFAERERRSSGEWAALRLRAG